MSVGLSPAQGYRAPLGIEANDAPEMAEQTEG